MIRNRNRANFKRPAAYSGVIDAPSMDATSNQTRATSSFLVPPLQRCRRSYTNPNGISDHALARGITPDGRHLAALNLEELGDAAEMLTAQMFVLRGSAKFLRDLACMTVITNNTQPRTRQRAFVLNIRYRAQDTSSALLTLDPQRQCHCIVPYDVWKSLERNICVFQQHCNRRVALVDSVPAPVDDQSIVEVVAPRGDSEQVQHEAAAHTVPEGISSSLPGGSILSRESVYRTLEPLVARRLRHVEGHMHLLHLQLEKAHLMMQSLDTAADRCNCDGCPAPQKHCLGAQMARVLSSQKWALDSAGIITSSMVTF